MAQSTKYRMLLLMRSVRGEEGETGMERRLKQVESEKEEGDHKREQQWREKQEQLLRW